MTNSWLSKMIEKIGIERKDAGLEYEPGEDISNAEPERDYASVRQPRPTLVERPVEQKLAPMPRQTRPEYNDAVSVQYIPRRGEDNMVEINSRRTLGAALSEQRHHTIIYYLRAFEDCKDVIDDLIEQNTILLNLEDMDDKVNQRVIDMLSGAAYALDATLKRAAKATYLIAPKNVDVTDLKETSQGTMYKAQNILRSIK